MSSGIIAASALLVGTGAQLYSANKASKDAKALAAESANAKPVDILKLQQEANAVARQNAFGSKALEAELDPNISRLRNLTSSQLLRDSVDNANDGSTDFFKQKVLDSINNPDQLPALQRSDLFDAATNKALSDLQLGGGLDTATRNEVTRRALATSSNVSGGDLGLGRDISARDLGLTSLNLQQARLQAAMQQGNQDLNFNIGQQGSQAQQNQLNRSNLAAGISAYGAIGANKQNQNLSLAQYIQNIQQPTFGIDPGSIVDISMGNSNNQANAQQQALGIRAQANANRQAAIGSAIGNTMGMIGNVYGAYANTQKSKGSLNGSTKIDLTPIAYKPGMFQTDIGSNIYKSPI